MARVEHRPGEAVFDVARALAALAVLLSHARSFVLIDAKDQPPLSIGGQAFYALSGLGHQAVIVFFVLSGTLVTGSLLTMHAGGRWSGARFATARLIRLWVVLVPCLILGGLLDHVGEEIGDQLVYAGHYGALRPAEPAVPVRLDGSTLAGNLVFLQTIVVRPFGTNVPLWSLSNEAWYYAGAFLVVALWRVRGRPWRALTLAALLASLGGLVMTRTLWLLLPTWALGAGLAVVGTRWPPTTTTVRVRYATLAMFVAVLVLTRVTATTHQLAGDYTLALAFAAVLVAHRHWSGSAVVMRPLRGLAGLSYSLYLSHFPLLALLSATALRNVRLPFGAEGLAWLSGAVLGALAWASLVWWLFERHTGRVRRWVEAWPSRRWAIRRVLPPRQGARP